VCIDYRWQWGVGTKERVKANRIQLEIGSEEVKQGDSSVSSLGEKRLEAAFTIASYAVSSGATTAAPTLGVEIPKQIVLTASDILMYTFIWKVYFEEDLSHKGLLDMMTELGLVTVAGAGTAYIVAKGSTAVLSEITKWLGPVGWGVSAAIASSITGVFGAAWALYCDRLYCERETQSTMQ
jgi:hypothetical protein